MKHVIRLGIIIAVMSIPAFAINIGSTRVTFATPVRVGSSNLAAGDYKVTWKGSRSEVQVSFAQGRKVVAMAPAKLTQADNEATTSQAQHGVAVDTAQESNTTVLQELQLPHLNLLFEGNLKAAQ